MSEKEKTKSNPESRRLGFTGAVTKTNKGTPPPDVALEDEVDASIRCPPEKTAKKNKKRTGLKMIASGGKGECEWGDAKLD